MRVRVRGSYRASRTSGYGYGSLRELPEIPGIVARTYITHRVPGGYKTCRTRTPGIVATRTELTEVQSTGMKVVQNLQKFRVRV